MSTTKLPTKLILYKALPGKPHYQQILRYQNIKRAFIPTLNGHSFSTEKKNSNLAKRSLKNNATKAKLTKRFLPSNIAKLHQLRSLSIAHDNPFEQRSQNYQKFIPSFKRMKRLESLEINSASTPLTYYKNIKRFTLLENLKIVIHANDLFECSRMLENKKYLKNLVIKVLNPTKATLKMRFSKYEGEILKFLRLISKLSGLERLELDFERNSLLQQNLRMLEIIFAEIGKLRIPKFFIKAEIFNYRETSIIFDVEKLKEFLSQIEHLSFLSTNSFKLEKQSAGQRFIKNRCLHLIVGGNVDLVSIIKECSQLQTISLEKEALLLLPSDYKFHNYLQNIFFWFDIYKEDSETLQILTLLTDFLSQVRALEAFSLALSSFSEEISQKINELHSLSCMKKIKKYYFQLFNPTQIISYNLFENLCENFASLKTIEEFKLTIKGEELPNLQPLGRTLNDLIQLKNIQLSFLKNFLSSSDSDKGALILQLENFTQLTEFKLNMSSALTEESAKYLLNNIKGCKSLTVLSIEENCLRSLDSMTFSKLVKDTLKNENLTRCYLDGNEAKCRKQGQNIEIENLRTKHFRGGL